MANIKFYDNLDDLWHYSREDESLSKGYNSFEECEKAGKRYFNNLNRERSKNTRDEILELLKERHEKNDGLDILIDAFVMLSDRKTATDLMAVNK